MPLQLEWAVPAEPPHVQACMDVAVEYARAERARHDTPGAQSEGPAATADIQITPEGQPNDMPYQAHTEGDVLIGRVVLDVRDMSARCVGLAALRPEHWGAILGRVRDSTAASPLGLRGSRGEQWLAAVQQSVLTGGEGPKAVEGPGAAAALLPPAAAVPAEERAAVDPRQGAATLGELWAAEAQSDMTDEERQLADILALKDGTDEGSGEGRADGGAGETSTATGADILDDGRRVAAMVAMGMFRGSVSIPVRGVPDVRDPETFAAGMVAMETLQRIRDIGNMTMGQCMHELSWRTPTWCALQASFARGSGSSSWGEGARVVGPATSALERAPDADGVPDAAAAPASETAVADATALVATASDVGGGGVDLPAEEVVVQQWLSDKRQEAVQQKGAAVDATEADADLPEVLLQLPVALPTAADVSEDGPPQNTLKTAAGRRAREAYLRTRGAQTELLTDHFVTTARELMGSVFVSYTQFLREVADSGEDVAEAQLEGVRQDTARAVLMVRRTAMLGLMRAQLPLDTPRLATAAAALLDAVMAEESATIVDPSVQAVLVEPVRTAVAARVVEVRGGAVSAPALMRLLDGTEEMCGVFTLKLEEGIREIREGGDDPVAWEESRPILADVRRLFLRAFEELVDIEEGTLVRAESAADALAQALNNAPAAGASAAAGRGPRQRALGAGAATLRGGSRGGSQLAAGGGVGPASAPWMRGLDDKQVAEYYLKQRREFDQVTEMLQTRVAAREVRLRNGEPVLEGMSEEERGVVQEQEAVLREIRRNRVLLDRQVAERLGVPAAGLARAATVADVLTASDPAEEAVGGVEAEEMAAAWAALAAILADAPPHEGQMESAVQQVRTMMLSQGDAAAAALTEASDALDFLEGTDAQGGAGAARSQALQRIDSGPKRVAKRGGGPRHSKAQRGSSARKRAEEYIEQMKDADAQKLDQVRLRCFGPGWGHCCRLWPSGPVCGGSLQDVLCSCAGSSCSVSPTTGPPG